MDLPLTAENFRIQYYELEEMIHSSTVLPHNDPGVISQISSRLEMFCDTFLQV
jgi:hypothetical protein